MIFSRRMSSCALAASLLTIPAERESVGVVHAQQMRMARGAIGGVITAK